MNMIVWLSSVMMTLSSVMREVCVLTRWWSYQFRRLWSTLATVRTMYQPMILLCWYWLTQLHSPPTSSQSVFQHQVMTITKMMARRNQSWWSQDGVTLSLYHSVVKTLCLPRFSSILRSDHYLMRNAQCSGTGEKIFDSGVWRNICVSRSLRADHLCVWTREPGRAACQGDSGGPLTRVTNITSYQRQLLGVISLGPSVCGAGTFPVIVSRLQGDVLDWVHNLIHDK